MPALSCVFFASFSARQAMRPIIGSMMMSLRMYQSMEGSSPSDVGVSAGQDHWVLCRSGFLDAYHLDDAQTEAAVLRDDLTLGDGLAVHQHVEQFVGQAVEHDKAFGAEGEDVLELHLGDRKSTRLKSSH